MFYINICFQGFQKSGQAPIDLIDEIVQPKRFPPLILNGHWLKDGNATLFNDGSTGTQFVLHLHNFVVISL